jgi:hypothetical protein
MAVCAVLWCARPEFAQAQDTRHASGVVERASARGTTPVSGQWVVLHRVAHENAGPVDSVRTDDRGRYAFRYTARRDSAVYFASVRYAGVAYFTPPFVSPDVTGADAALTVFDTSSTAPLRTRARHMVVFAPDATRMRHIADVYWIENTADKTRVTVGTVPSWQAMLPDGASNVRVDDGDISAGFVSASNGRLAVLAPLAPGLRQLQVSYDIPAAQFPLSVPVSDSLTMLELLVEDPAAWVSGAKLVGQAVVNANNHTFQRFLAQDVPRSAAFTIGSGRSGPISRSAYIAIVVGVIGAALLIGLARTMLTLGVSSRREGSADRATDLAREIVVLDERFNKRANPNDEERASYTARRDALKANLTAVLAERDDRL